MMADKTAKNAEETAKQQTGKDEEQAVKNSPAPKADETSKKEKDAGKKGKKKPNIFKRVFGAIVRFFRDTKGELKRVVWPTRKQVRNNLIVVLVFCVCMALLIFALDYAFSWLMKFALETAETIRTQQSAASSSSTSVAAAVSGLKTILSLM
ncbi:MAG: preprotein translocase subunit SecE [Oscillospiraceae bacterium]